MRKARASYNPDQKKFLAQQLNDRIDEWIAGASDARHDVEDKVLELAKADHSLEATDWTRNMISPLPLNDLQPVQDAQGGQGGRE